MFELQHKKLEVWKLSIELATRLYRLTENFPKTEIYGIANQLRRAAVSVASNIAEGAARKSSMERRRFFEIGRSSLVEIDTQPEISLKLNFCNNEALIEISENVNHLFAKISNLIQKTK